MNLADITSAARLLLYALGPKERPTAESQYRALLDRYRTDTEFAEIVSRVADGLGLELRVPTQLGLLVAGWADGPFAVTLDNSGLVLIALAAYAYPNGESLVDSTNPTVHASELERFLDRQLAAIIEAAHGVDDDLDGQLGAAAREWQDLPSVLPAERGGLRRDCRRDYVQRTLEFLVTQGRARREPTLDDERGKAYALNDRFRIGMGETIESVVFETLASAAREDAG
jgi:hypothetical protein